MVDRILDAQEWFGILPAWFTLAAPIVFGSILWWVRSTRAETRDAIAQWLKGEYQGNLSTSFCNWLDKWYGATWRSWRRVIVSTSVSVGTVVLGYTVLSRVEGVSARFDGRWLEPSILIVGLALNAVADFISNIETRYLLQRIQDKGRLWTICIICGDFLATFVIALATNFALRWGFEDLPTSFRDFFVETVAFYSEYSIFFYSTFTTSLIFWVFAISAGISGLTCRAVSGGAFDPSKHTGFVAALSGTTVISLFVAGAVFSLEVQPNTLTRLDNTICGIVSASGCKYVARLTENQETIFEVLKVGCAAGDLDTCNALIEQAYEESGVRDEDMAEHARIGCKSVGGDPCTLYATHLMDGQGVVRDELSGLELLTSECKAGHDWSCYELEQRRFVGSYEMDPDPIRALRQLNEYCDSTDGGFFCLRLVGLAKILADLGLGRLDDFPQRAIERTTDSCRQGNVHACSTLQSNGFLPDDLKSFLLEVCSEYMVNTAYTCREVAKFAIRDNPPIVDRQPSIEQESGFLILQEACLLGDRESCDSLTSLLRDDEYQLPTFILEYNELVQLLCDEHHNVDACIEYSYEQITSTGVLGNEAAAHARLTSLCTDEEPEHCARAARALRRYPALIDYRKDFAVRSCERGITNDYMIPCQAVESVFLYQDSIAYDLDRGRELLRDSCGRLNSDSCLTLAEHYFDNQELDVDEALDKSRHYFRISCDLRQERACRVVAGLRGYWLITRPGFNKLFSDSADWNRIAPILITLCIDHTNSEACARLAAAEETGKSLPDSTKASIEYAIEGCFYTRPNSTYDQGDPCRSFLELSNEDSKRRPALYRQCLAFRVASGCSELLTLFLRSGTEDDRLLAQLLLAQLCNARNDVVKCWDIYVKVGSEISEIVEDYGTVFLNSFELMCRNHDSFSCGTLANWYGTGKNVDFNSKTSVKYYEMACEKFDTRHPVCGQLVVECFSSRPACVYKTEWVNRRREREAKNEGDSTPR